MPKNSFTDNRTKNRKYKPKCLLDTGSTIPLLNKNLPPEFKRIKLKKPIFFNTINGNFVSRRRSLHFFPKEDNLMCWKLTNFNKKNFDGLIGQNILKAFSAIINLEEDFLQINGNKIKFVDSCSYSSEEIQTLEAQSDNILDKLKREDMNKEEEKILIELIFYTTRTLRICSDAF